MIRKQNQLFGRSDASDRYRGEVESEEEQSPGEMMRRENVKSKERIRDSPERGQSGNSRDAIRPRLDRDRGNRNSMAELYVRSIRNRASLDSPRSSKKRSSIYNSTSSRDSGQSAHRQTDLFHPVSAKYRNTHIRGLQSCLRETPPSAEDPPLALWNGPALLPGSNQSDDMGKVGDVLLTRPGVGKWTC